MLAAVSRREFAAWIAFALLGAVGGAVFAIVRLGHEVDRLTLDNIYLMDQIEYLTNRIHLLDTRGPTSAAYVEAIEISAQGVERARPGVEQALKDLLAHLVGEELERINAATIHRALERTITVDRHEYAVQVKYIYVAPTLRVQVQVHDASDPDLIE